MKEHDINYVTIPKDVYIKLRILELKKEIKQLKKELKDE